MSCTSLKNNKILFCEICSSERKCVQICKCRFSKFLSAGVQKKCRKCRFFRLREHCCTPTWNFSSIWQLLLFRTTAHGTLHSLKCGIMPCVSPRTVSTSFLVWLHSFCFFTLIRFIWWMLQPRGGARGVPRGATAPKILPGPPSGPPKIFQVSFWKSYTDHWQLPLLQNWPLQWSPQMKMSGSAPAPTEGCITNAIEIKSFITPQANKSIKSLRTALSCIRTMKF